MNFEVNNHKIKVTLPRVQQTANNIIFNGAMVYSAEHADFGYGLHYREYNKIFNQQLNRNFLDSIHPGEKELFNLMEPNHI